MPLAHLRPWPIFARMTATLARLHREIEYHDKVARRVTNTPGQNGWAPSIVPTWADEPMLSPTMARRLAAMLGDVSGKKVLIYGCGFDPGATWFARRGANVTAIDLSPESVKDQRV